MPKKYGVKEKDLVVAHVVNLVLTGKLRSGDRLDRNEIAEELGLEPSARPGGRRPARARRHAVDAGTTAGAFVERFDEAVVREHHELYGVLNGIAVGARGRRTPRRRSSTSSAALLDALRATDGVAGVSRARRGDYRTAINDEYAGPRLQAAIRASQTFMPRTFWIGLPRQPRRAAAVLRSRRPPRSATATPTRRAPRASDRAAAMGRIMLAELIRRRVLRRAVARAVRCVLNERNRRARAATARFR